MKKLYLLIIGIITLTSCTSTSRVTSHDEYDRSIRMVQEDLSSKGYELSGHNEETSNNTVVTGTSYSKYAGYGTKMSNDFFTRDNYSFSNSQGDVVEISLKVRERYSSNSDINYLETVELLGCKTSKASDYDKICGSKSVVEPTLGQMNKDIDVQVFDAPKTYLLIIGLSCGIPLLMLPFIGL